MVRLEGSPLLVAVLIIIIIIIAVISISRSAMRTSCALEGLTWPSPWGCFSLFLIPSSLFELQPGASGAATWVQVTMQNVSPGTVQQPSDLPWAAVAQNPASDPAQASVRPRQGTG